MPRTDGALSRSSIRMVAEGRRSAFIYSCGLFSKRNLRRSTTSPVVVEPFACLYNFTPCGMYFVLCGLWLSRLFEIFIPTLIRYHLLRFTCGQIDLPVCISNSLTAQSAETSLLLTARGCFRRWIALNAFIVTSSFDP